MSELLSKFREQHPVYKDTDDATLADGIYNKYYAGKIDRPSFDAKVGLTPAAPAQADPSYNKNLEPFSGGLLPLSRSEYGGDVSFDSDAGIFGPIKRAFQLPGQVFRGEVNPLSDEGSMRALEMASVITPMSPIARMGGGMASTGTDIKAPSGLAGQAAYRQPQKASPTRAALKEATSSGYREARELGAEYTPQSISKWADDTLKTLDAEGRIAENFPKVHALINKLRNPPEGSKSISLESVDALYKRLGDLGANPDEGKVAALVQKSLDDFHARLGPEALVAGTATPAKAAEILKTARGNAAAGFRSDRITGMEKTAARRTAAANSGRNTDNAIRQRLTSLIESQKGSRGLSKAEEQAIDDIIFGRPTKNAARFFGNLLGGGGGLGSAFLGGGAGYAGATALGPAGALLAVIPPVIGAGSRSIANQMSKNELKLLDAQLRSRSPLANSIPTPAPVYQPGALQGGGEAMIGALRASAASTDNEPQPESVSQVVSRLLASPNPADKAEAFRIMQGGAIMPTSSYGSGLLPSGFQRTPN